MGRKMRSVFAQLLTNRRDFCGEVVHGATSHPILAVGFSSGPRPVFALHNPAASCGAEDFNNPKIFDLADPADFADCVHGVLPLSGSTLPIAKSKVNSYLCL